MSNVCGQALGSAEVLDLVGGCPLNAIPICLDLAGRAVPQLCPALGIGAVAAAEPAPFSGVLFPYTRQERRLFPLKVQLTLLKAVFCVGVKMTSHTLVLPP